MILRMSPYVLKILSFLFSMKFSNCKVGWSINVVAHLKNKDHTGASKSEPFVKEFVIVDAN